MNDVTPLKHAAAQSGIDVINVEMKIKNVKKWRK